VARGGLDLRRVLTLGGQAPPAVGALLAAMVAATVAGTASAPLARLMMLVVPPADAPGWLVLLEAWRIVTWPFFQGQLPASVVTLLFAGFMLLWLGRQLSYAWSERRFLVRFLVLAAGSGLATVLLLAPVGYEIGYFGIWPVVNALLVTWGLIFPSQRISWFGALDMTGRTVALVVTGATPAWALLVGPPGLGPVARLVVYLPHLLAIGLAWLLVAGGPRRAWYRAREWWLRRRLARKRSRFEVIDTGRPGKPPRWMN
jgi:membrane associated rhomboid family serine protease